MTGNDEALPQGSRLHNIPQNNHAKIKEADRSLFAIVVTMPAGPAIRKNMSLFQKKYNCCSTCFHISTIEDATPPPTYLFRMFLYKFGCGPAKQSRYICNRAYATDRQYSTSSPVNVRESCDTIESHKKSWPFFDFRFLFDGISVTPS